MNIKTKINVMYGLCNEVFIFIVYSKLSLFIPSLSPPSFLILTLYVSTLPCLSITSVGGGGREVGVVLGVVLVRMIGRGIVV